ncbi:MAG: Do family serine endopeptidase [Synergistaceae bacterium]|jgi:serine protease Do|nr:Do family serine endopeptidase [Synergistaceae bacterium]
MRVRSGFGVKALVLLATVGLCFFAGLGWAASQTLALGKHVDNPVVRIVKEFSPAVVNIDVETVSQRSALPFPFRDDPFFRRFFGEEFDRFSRSVPMKGRGSGFVVSKDGQILTNNHVVAGANKITVTLSDGKTYEANVLGKDPTFDLAVIKITPASELKTLELGDSDSIQVGEWVVAIGNPYGLEHTVTVGVISAKNRSIHTQGLNFDGFLQTDAAINPGNSGGPLIDMDGKVIGINTAIIPYAQGLGFAIPVNMARQIMNDLVTYGKVKRGWLGIAIQPLTKDFAEAYGISAENGVIVGDVFADSAADRAGLQRGDVIVSLDGENVKDTSWFINQVRSKGPGASLELQVIRAGKSVNVTAKLDEIPDNESQAAGDGGTDFFDKVGLAVSKLTNELRGQYKIENRSGLVVTQVVRGSTAQAVGFREGDVILEINRKKVNDPADVAGVIRKDSKLAALLVERGGRTFFVTLKMD